MLTSCSLHAHFMLTSCSLHAHFVLTSCSLHAHFMLTSCSLHAHFMLTSCSLRVYFNGNRNGDGDGHGHANGNRYGNRYGNGNAHFLLISCLFRAHFMFMPRSFFVYFMLSLRSVCALSLSFCGPPPAIHVGSPRRHTCVASIIPIRLFFTSLKRPTASPVSRKITKTGSKIRFRYTIF